MYLGMSIMKYDVIVIGGGHAGIEASLASARLGHKTLLISILAEQIGAASCNPAIGGLAKGHLVKELDALGGQMALATDAAGIQFRILNLSKGPAVRGSRAQIDMDRYRIYMRNIILNTENLSVSQEMAEEIVTEDGKVTGVITAMGNHYHAQKIILTTGTFLRGLIHIGEYKHESGRVGEFPAVKLSASIKALGINMGRLKTGTCARIDAKTIDFSKMELQPGDENPFRLALEQIVQHLSLISSPVISPTPMNKRILSSKVIFIERPFLLAKLKVSDLVIVQVLKIKSIVSVIKSVIIFSSNHKHVKLQSITSTALAPLYPPIPNWA